MWRLLQANLQYQWRISAYGFFVALVLATAVNVILPVLALAPDPDDDFKLFYFYPVFVVFLGLVLAFFDFASQRKESRLITHTLLPATRMQVGLARLLCPPALLLACLCVSLGMMVLLQLAMGIELEAWRCYFLVFFAGFFLVLVQGAALIEELKPALRRSTILRVTFSVLIVMGVGVMLLRALDRYIHLLPNVAATLRTDISLDPESPSSSVVLHSLGWGITLVTTILFRYRHTMIDE